MSDRKRYFFQIIFVALNCAMHCTVLGLSSTSYQCKCCISKKLASLWKRSLVLDFIRCSCEVILSDFIEIHLFVFCRQEIHSLVCTSNRCKCQCSIFHIKAMDLLVECPHLDTHLVLDHKEQCLYHQLLDLELDQTEISGHHHLIGTGKAPHHQVQE